MNAGQGSISFSGKQPPSGAPFPAGSANNGLSVDPVTGKIVLGNDIPDTGLAKLLSNRFIDLAGFEVRFQDGVIGAGIAYEIGNSAISILDDATQAGISLNIFAPGSAGIIIESDKTAPGSPEPTLDFSTSTVGTETMRIRNSAGTLAISNTSSSDEYLQIDSGVPGGIIFLGDLSSAGNSSEINLNDPFQFLDFSSAAVSYLHIDVPAKTFIFGDDFNGNDLKIDGINFETYIKMNAFKFLDLDATNGKFQFGDIASFAQGNYFDIDNPNAVFTFFQGTNQFLSINIGAADYRIGDISASLNGNTFEIDDTGSQMFFSNTATNTQLVVNAPAPDANQAINIRSLTNGAFDGVKVWAQNLTTFAQFGYEGVETNGNAVVNSQGGGSVHLQVGGADVLQATVTGITTTDPGGGAGEWQLGKFTAGAVALDATNYIETKIDGVIRKILIAA